jgi:hypothetical protein
MSCAITGLADAAIKQTTVTAKIEINLRRIA